MKGREYMDEHYEEPVIDVVRLSGDDVFTAFDSADHDVSTSSVLLGE